MRQNMKIVKSKVAILTVGAMMLYVTPLSAEVTVPNEFQSGNTAKAGDVNANFKALQDALNQALDRIDELEQQTENLRAMNEHVSVVADDANPNEQRIVFEGVNLQLVDGAGKTAQENNESNGLGNLIVGYGGARLDGFYTDAVCSDGSAAATNVSDNSSDCASAGAVWAADHRSGSHNVVIGYENAYSANGGLIVGISNAVTRGNAVTFGFDNVARGTGSVVLGGEDNRVSGNKASVTSGFRNKASGSYASVTGGDGNTASGSRASVAGGTDNTASGMRASVTGGFNNTALGTYTSVSGGEDNTAGSRASSVTGGFTNETSEWHAVVVGGSNNEASNLRAVVVGGSNNTASGERSVVLGGDNNTESTNEQTIPTIP